MRELWTGEQRTAKAIQTMYVMPFGRAAATISNAQMYTNNISDLVLNVQHSAGRKSFLCISVVDFAAFFSTYTLHIYRDSRSEILLSSCVCTMYTIERNAIYIRCPFNMLRPWLRFFFFFFGFVLSNKKATNLCCFCLVWFRIAWIWIRTNNQQPKMLVNLSIFIISLFFSLPFEAKHAYSKNIYSSFPVILDDHVSKENKLNTHTHTLTYSHTWYNSL